MLICKSLTTDLLYTSVRVFVYELDRLYLCMSVCEHNPPMFTDLHKYLWEDSVTAESVSQEPDVFFSPFRKCFALVNIQYILG